MRHLLIDCAILLVAFTTPALASGIKSPSGLHSAPPVKGGPIIQPFNPRPPGGVVGQPIHGPFPPTGGITVLSNGQRFGIGIRLR